MAANNTVHYREESDTPKKGNITYMNVNLNDYVSKDYLKRRSAHYEKKNELVLKIFALILSVCIAGSIIITNAIKEDPKLIQTDEIILVVKDGNTLWGMVDDYTPYGMDIRQFIEIVKTYNEMDSSTIYAGDVIHIPLFETIY